MLRNYSPRDDNNKYRLSKAIAFRAIKPALEALGILIKNDEKIDRDLANRAFSLGVEKLHDGVVKDALKLGADIELLYAKNLLYFIYAV